MKSAEMNGWTGLVTGVETSTAPQWDEGDPVEVIGRKLFITLSDGTKIEKELPGEGPFNRFRDFEIGDKVKGDSGSSVTKI